MFGVPKKGGKSIQMVGNFCKLNKMLLRNPQFIETIHDLLMSVGYWEWVSTADLNMGYYAMRFSPESRQI
eukprot:3278762-Ditylum_brightwellii.AAC.1